MCGKDPAGLQPAGLVRMRRAARILVLLGALGSLACTLYVGQHNRSLLLPALFAAWVAAPFVGVLAVLRGVEGGPTRAVMVLQSAAIIISIAALGLYVAFALRPLGHSAAAPFLLIPVCSWVAVAGMMLYAHANHR